MQRYGLVYASPTHGRYLPTPGSWPDVVANELSYDGQTVLGTYKAVCLGVGGCMYLEVVELLIYLSTEASVDGYVEA